MAYVPFIPLDRKSRSSLAADVMLLSTTPILFRFAATGFGGLNRFEFLRHSMTAFGRSLPARGMKHAGQIRC